MSSTQVRPKLLSVVDGYFISVGDNRGAMSGVGGSTAPTAAKVYVNTGSDALPAFSTNIYAMSSGTSTVCAAGGIMKDLGKTLISSGRVFRKVQLLVSSANTAGIAGTAGVSTAPDYLTGYIELPGQAIGSGVAGAQLTQVARLG